MTQIQILGLIMYHTGMRVDDWAKSKGFTKSTVYRVISGEMEKGKKTEVVRQAIATEVRKNLCDLWVEN